MLASWGCVRSSPTSSAASAWPLVPVPLAPTDLHFGSSLAIGFCLADKVLHFLPPRWLSGASRAEDPRFDSRLHRGDFAGSSQTSDLKIGTPVATLPGAWRYRVSAGTGWLCVSIMWLGEVESFIYNFYLSVVACKIVWADPSLRHISMLLGR